MNNTYKTLILVIVGVIAAVGSYMYVAKPNYDTVQSIQAENDQLRARLAELNQRQANREQYIADTAKFNEEFDKILNSFPADMNQEITIMFMQGIKDNNEFDIGALGLGKKESFYTLGSGNAAATLDGGAGSEPDIEAEEAEVSEEGDAAAEAAPAEVPAYTCYRASFPITYRGSYDSLKDVVAYVSGYSERMTINTIDIGYNADADEYSGSLNLMCYSIEGEDRPERSVNLDYVPTGVDNIFNPESVINEATVGMSKYDDKDGAAIETSYDFYAMLNPASSDVSAKVVGQNGTGKDASVISNSDDSISTLSYEFYEKDGKNYCKYTLDSSTSYEAEVTSAEDVKLLIQSSARKNSDDKVGLRVTISNSTTLPTPEKTGYKFDGWYTNKSGGTQVDINSKITKDSLSLRDEDLSFEGEVEEKEDELIICEQIREETFIRISNKFKLENKEENYENNNLETSSNLINNINSRRRHNTKIKSIKIVESTIEDLIIFNKIMKFISKKTIKKFFFVGNNINSDFEGWEAISSFFEQNYNLRYLDLHNSTIYDYHLTDLMRPLSDKRIRFLNLSENFITIDGVKIIAEFLKNNKTLQKLNLSRNAQTQFKSEGVKCILDSLSNNKNIECIDFSFMNLTGCGESIGNFITKNKSIENIVLKNVLLNFNDFKNIFVPLKKSKTLKEIDVSMNDMGGDKSLQIIADAIKENTSLECLRIDQININNDNYNIIFEAIENNKTIQKYSISYNSDIKPKIVINFFMRQIQVKYLEYIPFDKENDNDKNKSLSLEERKMFEKLQVDRPDLKLIYK